MKKNLLGLALLLAVTSSVADTELKSLKNISHELVEIRQQIESLHNKISYEKDAFKDQIRSYLNQKSDLDVRVSRADLNIKDLQRELQKLTTMTQRKNHLYESVFPILKESISLIRGSISDSLPFKLSQRLNALDEIEYRLDAQIISPNKAANQLWAFVEDELMLGKSSGIYNDTLNIEGQDKLVKVLRVGKIAMFYKTNEGGFGMMQKRGGMWQQQTLQEKKSVAQLEQLFDSFGKNIRNGQFTIPNFLPRS